MIARAIQFRRATIDMPDMEGPEPYWPKYALLGHAIELAIKAYLESSGGKGSIGNHDLVALYGEAVKRGMSSGPTDAAFMEVINDIHETHYARYPQTEARPVPLISQFDDLADRLIREVSSAVSS